MPDRQVLTESRPLAEAANERGVATIQLITPGWGSSGYYSSDVLSEAAKARVFPAGTHMYLDHPPADGAGLDEGGNRSVRDLAAVLVEDAHVSADGGLLAEAKVFQTWLPVLAEVQESIGVSVRARGMGEMGEAEGRKGFLITSIDEGISADFVVAAGRGGKILQLIESARATLTEGTVNDTREALGAALSDAYANAHTWCWVRDFDTDDSVVYFEVYSDGDGTDTYQQSYTIGDDGTATLLGERVEVNIRTEYVPVAATTATESVDADATTDEATEPVTESATTDTADAAGNAADSPTPIQEDHMTDTPGAGAPAPALSPRQVLEAGQAQLRAQVAELQARDRARTIISEALADAWLTNSTVARLSTELLEGLPIVNDILDEAALRDRIVAKRNVAETEAAEMLQAAGVGTPRGLGEGAGGSGLGTSPAEFEAELAEVFQGLGMSETAAKHAAKGR